MTSVKVVDFRNTLGAALVAAIDAAGYVPSDCSGYKKDIQSAAEHYNGSVGLLVQDPRDLPERYFFGLRRRPARMRLVAVIWTDNSLRKATPNRWVVETSGREDLEKVTEVMTKIARQFGAKVSIRLLGDGPVYESKLYDYDM